MKKKVLTVITILIAIVLLTIGISVLSFKNTVQAKGFELFGSDYCSEEHNEFGGDALTSWDCSLCGNSYVNSDTAIPVICNNCAILTGRCMKCGKLKE